MSADDGRDRGIDADEVCEGSVGKEAAAIEEIVLGTTTSHLVAAQCLIYLAKRIEAKILTNRVGPVIPHDLSHHTLVGI
jgi:hypothetical protein